MSAATARALLALAVLAAVAAAAAASAARAVRVVDGQRYVPTPAGWMLEACVRSVPSGAAVEEADDAVVVRHDSLPGGALRLALCTDVVRRLEAAHGRRVHAVLSHAAMARASPFPSDYQGWTSYTAFEHPDGPTATFDAFLGSFSVPNQPKREPDVLYLFTGLQNIDWIPLVDPLPSQDFDIIQPVLQYPGDFGRYWSVKSWYVTLNAGALESREEKVEVGGTIFGNMTRTAAQQWYIGSTVVSSGKTTDLMALNPRLLLQPWAYNTLECYGCYSCDYYPTNSCDFTGLALSTGETKVPATWKVDPKPSQHKTCHESSTVNSASAVTITFQQQ